MTERKLTDEEVIKALEHAMYSAKGEDGFKELHWEMLKDFLDLINRQKAEIEELRSKIGNLDIYPCRVRMNENCRVYARSLDDYDNLIGDIGNEAIKEFAEEFKKRCIRKGFYPVWIKNILADLVKEKTEGNDGKS